MNDGGRKQQKLYRKVCIRNERGGKKENALKIP